MWLLCSNDAPCCSRGPPADPGEPSQGFDEVSVNREEAALHARPNQESKPFTEELLDGKSLSADIPQIIGKVGACREERANMLSPEVLASGATAVPQSRVEPHGLLALFSQAAEEDVRDVAPPSSKPELREVACYEPQLRDAKPKQGSPSPSKSKGSCARKMERPNWTLTFGFLCLVVVCGAVLWNIAVVKLVPAIENLPGSVEKGLGEVLKFDYLEQDASSLQSTSATVLEACNIIPRACLSEASWPDAASASWQKMIPVGVAKAKIKNSFVTTLGIVSKFVNDPYLGTPQLAETAANLNKIAAASQEIPDLDAECLAASPIFCVIWVAADGLVKGMDVVNAEIDKLKKSDILEAFNDYVKLLNYLHCVPWSMVIAMCFFACFIWKNGVCCCCRQGTWLGTLALIPFTLFWLVPFVISAVVLGASIVLEFFKESFKVSVLKGEPSVGVVIEHLQQYYPEFWLAVFKEPEAALETMLWASYFLTPASLLISLYAMGVCCCCPYRIKLAS